MFERTPSTLLTLSLSLTLGLATLSQVACASPAAGARSAAQDTRTDAEQRSQQLAQADNKEIDPDAMDAAQAQRKQMDKASDDVTQDMKENADSSMQGVDEPKIDPDTMDAAQAQRKQMDKAADDVVHDMNKEADGHGHAHQHMDKDHDKMMADGEKAHHKMLVPMAIAVLMPTQGSSVEGTITFEQTKDGVIVTADVTGLEPNQKHGFHIHEFGDVSDPTGKAAGEHYNPENHEHALPMDGDNDDTRHAGDLGNLEADADGNATLTQTFDNISIAGTMNPILGRGLIIHAQPDDGGQPSGNAGDRIAQAVIGVASK